MIHLAFEIADGRKIEVYAEPDRTLMEVAKARDIPGIDADCGGCMACGTCYVVVPPPWSDKLRDQSSAERDMLEYVPDPEPHTRLSCQIPLSADMDGMVIRVPKQQR
jgi:2Fe-2S ferredoxin